METCGKEGAQAAIMGEGMEGYRNRMAKLLGGQYQAYLDSFQEKRLFGLRVNTGKISVEEFLKRSSLALRPVPWTANGFYYDGNSRPGKDPDYFAGLYYLQEPSAMAPAAMLPIQKGDMVLDLCAAPGGKSTELGCRLEGTGMLVANDISPSRAMGLLKNLERHGLANICVTSQEPERLAQAWEGFFDKILVDAPCSGEGMLRKDPAMGKAYLRRGPSYYQEIQTGIMDQALKLLRPGGYLLYSTCTFSLEENEQVVLHALRSREDMELSPLPMWEGACQGEGLPGSIRLYPHRIKGEGHFLALLHKKPRKGEARLPEREAFGLGTARRSPLPEELASFLKLLGKNFPKDQVVCQGLKAYLLPPFLAPGLKLRYLRTGLLLGELSHGRFHPSQALAMALKEGDFGQKLSLKKGDGRVVRYLKGETIGLLEGEGPIKGWCLVTMDGFPLGFAKGTGMALKNKYDPGWRWQ